MGKKGEKFLRMLRSTKNRPVSTDIKENIPNFLEKRPAKPNEYCRGMNKDGIVMGSDERPDKIEVTCEVEEATKDLKHNLPKSFLQNEGRSRSLSTPVAVKSVVITQSQISKQFDKFHNGNIDEKIGDASEIFNDISYTPNKLLLNPDSDGLQRSRSCEKIVPTKRHPTEVNLPNSLISTSSALQNISRGHRKEFPSKKPRSVYQEETNILFDPGALKRRSTSFVTISGTSFPTDLGCSMSITTEIPKSFFEASEQPSSSGDGSHHYENERRCIDEGSEWGWVKKESCNSESKRSSDQTNHRKHHAYHAYVNENPNTISRQLYPASRIAFIVTDKEGKGIELTVIESRIRLQFSKRNGRHPITEKAFNNTREQHSGSNTTISVHSLEYEVDYETTRDRMIQHPERRNFRKELSKGRSFVMTPNPDSGDRNIGPTMSAIRPANGILYRAENNDIFMRPSAFNFHPDGIPSFKLTEESMMKLLSYCGYEATKSLSWEKILHDESKKQKLLRLVKIFETVEECPWYWGNLNGQDSKNVLRETEPGTFLLRLSADPKYLFSLSVKTRHGPTSIRIVYDAGVFRLDSDMNDANSQRSTTQPRNEKLPGKDHPNYVKKTTNEFTCVINLVLNHTRHLGYNRPKSKCSICSSCENSTSTPSTESRPPVHPEERSPERFMCYWVSRSGRREIPVLLSKPLSKKQSFPSLQTLCRKSLNQSLELWKKENRTIVDECPLPRPLKKFIKRYPYPI